MKSHFGELQIQIMYVGMYSTSWIVICFPYNFCLLQRIIRVLKSSYLDSTIIQIKRRYLNSAAFKVSRLYKKFYLIALLWLV